MGNNKNSRPVKTCPFLDGKCIGDKCAIHVYLSRGTPEGVVQVLSCGIEAMVILLSEINAKAAAPLRQDKPGIVLPFKGVG